MIRRQQVSLQPTYRVLCLATAIESNRMTLIDSVSKRAEEKAAADILRTSTEVGSRVETNVEKDVSIYTKSEMGSKSEYGEATKGANWIV